MNRAFLKFGIWNLLFIFSISSCSTNTYKQGEMLYKAHCSDCHMDDGQGLKLLIPPLAGVNFLAEDRSKIACIIKNGLNDTLQINNKTYFQEMIAIPHLIEAEMTNIINYINQAWGNDLGYVMINEVKAALEACE